ncbi:ribonuclease III [Ehrlichia chaffeensis str. Heartland]|uniref:Ribonuclease 3 n=1 Tax=Ehrlichia chaffeensis (strain ATCC CRL-10679 / Arkansas) TaxID=205920 RepID=RNC_EHRCR|nr:ribonuclease III [Ehrlichia chaffeensis]Q2GFE4.1 RecName: Full=Ribonuclease 3; AltName: Full=Ribonuclease III; Short=RNase III [Ehrlichia chaffeensis str. Arkansas]ABD44996.1 ribonuclease III [Ehrlichia chaffeensis str. Arkansas]AHX03294.1 ribonuclease III [Ehrlichia chaffeensis str. Heartland]AHX05211.1 ribonuclease III [Ehrlichia chaffeensis str. Jax]AHX06200.1 ribonuclease III [Ehrlichia chaffeensis str. Liberty]AHX08036.1 ribonuclease III [Ehrlichia chaffeensis str. Osceola]
MIESISKIIKYNFKNPQLLNEALTHPSLVSKDTLKFNYERLEFLGDAVLNIVISEMLFNIFPKDTEGNLAKKKTALVCGNKLVEVAQSINLGQFIMMSDGERACGGINNFRNLENALEALIGAIYLDGGFTAAQDFIYLFWEHSATHMNVPPQDAKTILQELVQGKRLPAPAYHTIDKSGPDHNPTFTVEVRIPSYQAIQATGHNKKLAEQKAASLMLNQIHNKTK